MKKIFSSALIFMFFAICVQHVVAQNSAKNYKKEIEEWDTKRLLDLKSATGWVNLAGLFWLNSGENRFGKDSSNNVIFNHPNFPDFLGKFIVSEKEVKWITNPENQVYIRDKKIDELVIFHVDSSSNPSLSFSTFKWSIIKRENKIGVRFRDLNNPALSALTNIDRYRANPKWIINASLKTSMFSTIAITNVLGQTTQQASPGKLVFQLNQKTYKLDVIDEGPGDMFVIFGDETNGDETYHTGRFLYVSRPDENGNTTIDFNKSHNPPCAFTTFATCPIPPRQNIIPVRIEAGEKNLHH
jgi:uncharacterized protein (DUF1684 family)